MAARGVILLGRNEQQFYELAARVREVIPETSVTIYTCPNELIEDAKFDQLLFGPYDAIVVGEEYNITTDDVELAYMFEEGQKTIAPMTTFLEYLKKQARFTFPVIAYSDNPTMLWMLMSAGANHRADHLLTEPERLRLMSECKKISSSVLDSGVIDILKNIEPPPSNDRAATEEEAKMIYDLLPELPWVEKKRDDETYLGYFTRVMHL